MLLRSLEDAAPAAEAAAAGARAAGGAEDDAQDVRCRVLVDDLGVDVFAFGLITDFRGLLFEGTRRLLEPIWHIPLAEAENRYYAELATRHVAA